MLKLQNKIMKNSTPCKITNKVIQHQEYNVNTSMKIIMDINILFSSSITLKYLNPIIP